MFLLEQFTLSGHKLMSSSNRCFSSLLHIFARLCYSTFVTGATNRELSLLDLEPSALAFISESARSEVDLAVIVDSCEIDSVVI